MRESTKEWLGIKPADLVIYGAFALLVPAYFSNNRIIDIAFVVAGFVLCVISCWIGMKPHKDLSKTTNSIKLIAYPACTVFFVYLAISNFTS